MRIVLQHLQTNRPSGASAKLVLNPSISFFLRDAMLVQYLLLSCVCLSVFLETKIRSQSTD